MLETIVSIILLPFAIGGVFVLGCLCYAFGKALFEAFKKPR